LHVETTRDSFYDRLIDPHNFTSWPQNADSRLGQNAAIAVAMIAFNQTFENSVFASAPRIRSERCISTPGNSFNIDYRSFRRSRSRSANSVRLSAVKHRAGRYAARMRHGSLQGTRIIRAPQAACCGRWHGCS